MKPTRHFLPLGLCALTPAMIFCTVGFAHHGEPAPAPPVPPVTREYIQYRQPPRWSWVHWWEANRDNHLAAPRYSVADPVTEKRKPDATRKRALAALTAALQDEQSAGPRDQSQKEAAGKQSAALKSKRGRLRSAALLALARMGPPEAFDTIADAARSDPDPNVRRAAVLALGLLGTPDAEKMLIEDRKLRGDLEEVRTAALGLLRKISPQASEHLQSTVVNRTPDKGSIASWGLQSGSDAGSGRLFEDILRNSPSAWLASDALLFLGRSQQFNAIPLLAELLLSGPGSEQIIAYRVLNAAENLLRSERQQRDLALQYGLSQNRTNPGRASQTQPVPAATARPIISGEQLTYAAELRGSAAMALGMLDDPRSRQTLLRVLNLPDNLYSNLYKGPALISLGMIGDERCLDALIAVLFSKQWPNSPLPGYAAIGLGLYARSDHPEPDPARADRVDERNDQPSAARPAQAGQAKPPAGRAIQQNNERQVDRQGQNKEEEDESPAGRVGFKRALTALKKCLLNKRETVELRAACALGMGLSQRPEALPTLEEIANPVRQEPEVLVGYSLLARGPLHDRTLIEPARKLLILTRKRTDMNALLAQRAAILGLGLLDDEDAIPILQEAWNLNYYASREVILALSLSRSTTVGDILLDLLEKSEDPEEQAYLSLCVGEVFAREQRSPLSRFITDTNYMMRNDNLRPYQSLANEFLLNFLTPAFGDQWR